MTPLDPAIVVHGLAHARLALAPDRPVTLLSGYGAGLYAGAGWWRALMAQARTPGRRASVSDVLDCADAPGAAMSALRLGQRIVLLDRACPALAAVRGAAAAIGAIVLTDRPDALDLAIPGAEARVAAWLTGSAANRCEEPP